MSSKRGNFFGFPQEKFPSKKYFEFVIEVNKIVIDDDVKLMFASCFKCFNCKFNMKIKILTIVHSVQAEIINSWFESYFR